MTRRHATLASLLVNASSDTLAANGFHRRVEPVTVLAKPTRTRRATARPQTGNASVVVADGATRIVLHGEVPKSWNWMYAGVHWSKRKQEKDRVAGLMRWASAGDVTIYQEPVTITFTAYFSGRRYDPDNLCVKFYIDTLKGWLLTNDSAVQVDSVTCQCRRDNEHPRLEIEVRKI